MGVRGRHVGRELDLDLARQPLRPVAAGFVVGVDLHPEKEDAQQPGQHTAAQGEVAPLPVQAQHPEQGEHPVGRRHAQRRAETRAGEGDADAQQGYHRRHEGQHQVNGRPAPHVVAPGVVVGREVELHLLAGQQRQHQRKDQRLGDEADSQRGGQQAGGGFPPADFVD